MKILAKLILGFIAVAVLCGVVGFVGINQVKTLNTEIVGLSDQSIPTITNLNQMMVDLQIVKIGIYSLTNQLGVSDDTFIKRQHTIIDDARKDYGKIVAEYEKLQKVPEEKALFDAVKAALPAALDFNNGIIGLVDKARLTKPEEGAVRDGIYQEIFRRINSDDRLTLDRVLTALDKLIQFDEQHYGKDLPAAAMASAVVASTLLLVVTIIAFLIAILLGIIFGSSISRPLKNTARIMTKVAEGDVSEKLTVKTKDEFREVAKAVNYVEDRISALITDADMLVKAAVEGRLATRADASKHQGDYRKIVEGVNQTLDSVIGPLNVAADYVEKISKGNIPEKITASYSGDFNVIKNNLNVCVDSVNALVTDAKLLVEAAEEGHLDTRADATKHQGDFRKIVDGVNRTLDLVVGPINEIIAIMKKMADGDLTSNMTGTYKGDFDVLKTALNHSIEAINDILGQVNTAVEQVNSGSMQVSQASQSLSQGATEQASSLEEITSSVTEIASQTKQNTENAIQVNGLSKGAKESAEHGNTQMKDLVSAMTDINRSAEEIRKIVKAIDDISFQINLLALNANVEAARAGKYGKGFAVVAEEVRNLAVHSASSVKETTRMVDEAISNIERGNALVDVTAKQLAEIVTGASKVVDLAEEVATASKEQSQGLEQVSTGLNQIDQVTQSNTASAEESASAAEELSAQAQQLQAMLQKFKLKAKENGKYGSDDILQLLRSEMARQGQGFGPAQGPAQKKSLEPAGTGGNGKKHLPQRTLRPQEIISLDDDNFGKF
ncbi:MAG TPA: methyl-accepting chemotaxis protein [Spirochaetia bacterium]|nr:methyl-accepting chemotaxis protein [Spirochaetia bacterium]